MLNYDLLAIYLALNVFIYLIIHVPLDLPIMLSSGSGDRRKESTHQPPLEFNEAPIKYIVIFTTLYFWAIFLSWPFLHYLGADELLMTFQISVPFFDQVFQIIGIILVGAGTTIACLGRWARGTRAISWGIPTELVESGGFKIVRHPLYASYCYYFIGLPLMLRNLLLFPLILGVPGYVKMALLEEKILEAEFGEKYREYQQRVGMIIPFVGKRKKR